ncbi:MAG: NUDIX domain-containing protein [Candidatus Nanoarchaeia archaeon]|nr:NUDIX domain-containing protein [Candidatus Nanoarchaeia archaeon]
MKELVDVLDNKGEPTGEVLTLDEVHKKGLWHSVSHVWVFNSKKQILIQKRGDVRHFPGSFDTSTAGHVSSKETPEQAASREMKEEIGINRAPQELKKIGVLKENLTIKKQNFFNNEFLHVFICKYDKDIKVLELQKEEINEIFWINITDFEKDINNPKKLKKYVPHKELYAFALKAIKKELK